MNCPCDTCCCQDCGEDQPPCSRPSVEYPDDIDFPNYGDDVEYYDLSDD